MYIPMKETTIELEYASDLVAMVTIDGVEKTCTLNGDVKNDGKYLNLFLKFYQGYPESNNPNIYPPFDECSLNLKKEKGHK